MFDLTRRDGYRAFLRAQAAVVLPLEAALTASGAHEILVDWISRRRTNALLADLRALGADDVPSLTVAAIDSTERLLGALYVLEGSRLGGAVLLRLIQSARIGVDHALAFLRHGNDGAFWRSFLPVLERVGASCNRDALLDAALQTFNTFTRAAILVDEERSSIRARSPARQATGALL